MATFDLHVADVDALGKAREMVDAQACSRHWSDVRLGHDPHRVRVTHRRARTGQ